MRRGWPTWTVAGVARRIGRDEDVARWYLEAYRGLGMAGRRNGRWWLRASARQALTATAPAEPAVADPAWLDDRDER